MTGSKAQSVGSCTWTHSFVEHSIVIGLLCVTADLTYSQGIKRMWTRKTRLDEYWPALAHLGEQPVYQQELYLSNTGSTIDQRNTVFGYQERYGEYRYYPSQITGLMRPQITGSLSYWHLSQLFSSAPTLSKEFIEENPPIDRVLAIQGEEYKSTQFVLDAWFGLRCARPCRCMVRRV